MANTSCSNTKNWTVSYEATGAEKPDLVLVFRIDGTGDTAELKANFDTSSDSVNFQPSTLMPLLIDCAAQLADDPTEDDSDNGFPKDRCNDLSGHIGEVLFRGEGRLFDNENLENNLNGSISVGGSTSQFFVIFMYSVSDENADADERCLQMLAADKVDGGFSVDGAGTDTAITYQFGKRNTSGDVNLRGCFKLGFN